MVGFSLLGAVGGQNERKEFEEMCSRRGFSKVTFLKKGGAEGTAKVFRLAGRRKGTPAWARVTVRTFISRTQWSWSLHEAAE